jgi:hypothetical protein
MAIDAYCAFTRVMAIRDTTKKIIFFMVSKFKVDNKMRFGK